MLLGFGIKMRIAIKNLKYMNRKPLKVNPLLVNLNIQEYLNNVLEYHKTFKQLYFNTLSLKLIKLKDTKKILLDLLNNENVDTKKLKIGLKLLNCFKFNNNSVKKQTELIKNTDLRVKYLKSIINQLNKQIKKDLRVLKTKKYPFKELIHSYDIILFSKGIISDNVRLLLNSRVIPNKNKTFISNQTFKRLIKKMGYAYNIDTENIKKRICKMLNISYELIYG